MSNQPLTTEPIPGLFNRALSDYVSAISAQYPDAEFYKERMRDSGRGEGPTLQITVCQNDGIIEEENFFYANQSELDADLENLVFYLEFA
ncbi:hypothetical protein [Hymenobacter edaphi]|uniref:hypothetical protein n=1 Tax=Hymenobacter edaphi TaxID=2211146 RepID=UPI0014039AA1|nr:hypothetical protein [Hymenobacter edaphi]